MKRFTTQQKRIVERIRRLHRNEVPLNISAMKRYQPRLLKQVMTLKHFRGWRRALEAAGLSYQDIHTELFDECVCALCGERLELLTPHLQAKHGMTKEEYQREFPNEPTESDQMRARNTRCLRRAPHWERVWSREYLIDYLIYKEERGDDLSPWTVYHEESGVHANLKKYFGSYRAAVEAAGIDYQRIRAIRMTEPWTAEKVLERIRQLHRREPLTSTGDIRRRDSRLYDSCYRYFGGAVSAIEAAGIPYLCLTARRTHRATKASIIHTIQVLDNSGLSLRPAALSGHLNGQADKLLTAAADYFGSWNHAVHAAGIDYENHRGRRTLA